MNPRPPRSPWLVPATLVLALPAAAQSYKLNAPLPSVIDGQVDSFEPSHDGSFVVLAHLPGFDRILRLRRASLEKDEGEVHYHVSPLPGFKITQDDSAIVYLARDASRGGNDLWSVASDGNAPPVRLSGALPPGGSVASFALAPDGHGVLYLADPGLGGRHELLAVPLGGGTPRRISGPPELHGSVLDFQTAPGSRVVVWRAPSSATGGIELFRGDLDGHQPVQRLSAAHEAGRDVRQVALARDGAWAVYRADSRADERFELFAVPTDRASAPRVLNQELPSSGDVADFALLTTGDTVVYRASAERRSYFDLYSVPVLGGEPRRLYAPTATNASVLSFALDAGERHILFRARFGSVADQRLYAVPTTGAAPAVRLDQDGHDEPLLEFLSSPDGSTAVYFRAEPGSGRSLYATPLDASQAPRLLARGLATDSDTPGFAEAGTSIVVGTTVFTLDGSRAPRPLAGPELDGAQLLRGERIVGEALLYRVRSGSPGQITDLFRAPLDGLSPARRVNEPIRAQYTIDSVRDFTLATQAARGLYAPQGGGLYAVRLAPDPRPVKLVDPMMPLAGPYRIHPAGSQAAYRQDGDLWVASTDGSQPPQMLATQAWPLTYTADGVSLLFAAPSGLGTVELWSATSGSRARLGAEVLYDSRYETIFCTPDGTQIVFAEAAAGTPGYELRAAPSDGSAPARGLGVVLIGSDEFMGVRLSPDGGTLVCTGRLGSSTERRLLAVPLPSAVSPVTLRLLAAGESVQAEVEPSSLEAVYLLSDTSTQALYRVPLAGGPSVPVLVPGAPPISDLVLSADGSRAILVVNEEVQSSSGGGYEGGVSSLDFDVLAVPLDGSTPPVQLNQARCGPGSVFTDRFGFVHLQRPLFVGPGAHAVFAEGPRLVAARLDGAAPGAELASEGGGQINALVFTSDNRSVVFQMGVTDGIALVQAALDGSRRTTLASWPGYPEFRSREAASSLPLAASRESVVYLANLDQLTSFELYLSFLDGHRNVQGVQAGTRPR